MKRILSILSVLVLFFCLSTQAFAYSIASPSSYSRYFENKGDYWLFKPYINLNSSYYKTWKSIFNKESPGAAFIYLQQNAGGSGDKVYLYYTTGTSISTKSNAGKTYITVPNRTSIFLKYNNGVLSQYSSPTTEYSSSILTADAKVIFYSSVPVPSAVTYTYVHLNGKPMKMNDVYSSKYKLTIDYQFEDGTKAADSYTQEYSSGASFSVTSPAITGYLPNQAIVSGSMASSDLSYTVTYKPIKHTLTIQYLHEDGSQAAQPYSASLQEGQTFSVYSPALNGYSPSQSQISGSMGTEDLSYTVTYKPIKHTLTIQYLHEDGSQAAQPYSASLQEGQTFSIYSPALNGYTPSQSQISGSMGTEDLSYTVTYKPIKHTLTIQYLHEDGSQAAQPYSASLQQGQAFSVATPVLDGYMPSLADISGTMGSENLSYTVTFTKIPEPTPPPSSSEDSSGSGDSSSGDSSAGNSGGSSSDDSGNASSDIDGGYIIWDPGVISQGFQNVSKQAGTAFNVGIWVFLGLAGIFLVVKLIHWLFR